MEEHFKKLEQKQKEKEMEKPEEDEIDLDLGPSKSAALRAKYAQSVLKDSFVQQELDALKKLLIPTGTAKRLPGWQYTERYKGDPQLSSSTYRDLVVYDLNPEKLVDPQYRKDVRSAWDSAKAAVELAFTNMPGAPKNPKAYLNRLDSPNPGEWLYKVESLIEAAEEKTEEGKAYATHQVAKQRVLDALQGYSANVDLQGKLEELAGQLDKENLKEWLRFAKDRAKQKGKIPPAFSQSQKDQAKQVFDREVVQLGEKLLGRQRSIASRVRMTIKQARNLIARCLR
jgi:hypothetical protein